MQWDMQQLAIIIICRSNNKWLQI